MTPLAASLDDLDDDRKKRLEDLANKLADWAPAKVADPVQRVRNLISLAATADVLQDPVESVLPLIIFQTLKSEFPKEQLIKMLTLIILHPEQGTVVTTAPIWGLMVEEWKTRFAADDRVQQEASWPADRKNPGGQV